MLLPMQIVFYNLFFFPSGFGSQKLWCHLCWGDNRRDNLPSSSTCNCL